MVTTPDKHRTQQTWANKTGEDDGANSGKIAYISGQLQCNSQLIAHFQSFCMTFVVETA